MWSSKGKVQGFFKHSDCGPGGQSASYSAGTASWHNGPWQEQVVAGIDAFRVPFVALVYFCCPACGLRTWGCTCDGLTGLQNLDF